MTATSTKRLLPVLAAMTDPEEAHQLLSKHARRCGRCTLCCTVLGIKALGKPQLKKCEHEVKHRGCAIYTTKPDECSHFYCAWKLGMLSTKDSPDEIGIVFDIYTEEDGSSVLRASEAWDGALERPRGMAALKAMARPPAKYVRIVRANGEQRVGEITAVR